MSTHNIWRGDSNEYPQHMFLWETTENYPLIIIKYPPYLFCCTSPQCPWLVMSYQASVNFNRCKVQIRMSSFSVFERSLSRIHYVSLRLIGRTSFQCAMYLLPLDLASKNQLSLLIFLLSTNQYLFNARANSWKDRWTCIIPLAMYPLHSVWNKACKFLLL